MGRVVNGIFDVVGVVPLHRVYCGSELASIRPRLADIRRFWKSK